MSDISFRLLILRAFFPLLASAEEPVRFGHDVLLRRSG
jgi:hypothetical protein